MTDIIEIPNLIDREAQQKLYDIVTGIDFPWHYLEDTTYEFGNKKSIQTPGFSHLLFSNDSKQSEFLDEFTPMFLKGVEACGLKLISTMRLRLGFLLKTRYNLPNMPYVYNTPHIDFDVDHYTALYYLNSCDGDTIIFNQTEESEKYSIKHRSTPAAGKFMLFNGNHYHASSCPKMEPSRIVLTMNFTAEKL
tara:strand:+ start:8878 stop:9453 length:576 start_codon:yes stop_codon:yes gene_type:complete